MKFYKMMDIKQDTICRNIADSILLYFREHSLDLIYHERGDEWTVFCGVWNDGWGDYHHFCYGSDMRYYISEFIIENLSNVDVTNAIVDGVKLALETNCTCFRFIYTINHVTKLMYKRSSQYRKEEEERIFAKIDAEENTHNEK